ncbi:MAG: hypothetical protein H6936_13350 [Burkholderiales bacterium]|nr:hypothetical protein [Burkholderiales bacterium]
MKQKGLIFFGNANAIVFNPYEVGVVSAVNGEFGRLFTFGIIAVRLRNTRKV